MKRYLILSLLAAIAVSGCQKAEKGEAVSRGKVFTATMEAIADASDIATKTSMDASGNVLWKQGDQVSIFVGSTINEHFQVTDASDGKTAASLYQVTSSGFVAGGEISNNVAFYPYTSTAAIAKRSGAYVISDIALPATQNYAAASFGNGAFPMTAVTGSASEYNLKFKNILGGVKLQLKGTAAITSISITGNNDEILCGAAEVTVSAAVAPAVSLAATDAKSVTLDCGDGVQLNPSTATAFIIALPPMTMTGGFTVTVTDSENKQMEIKSTRSQTITRSSLLAMPAVDYVGTGGEVLPEGSVDLGLPSGLLWASCNLCTSGFASSPEALGDYYAWGETAPYYANGYSQDNPCLYWRYGKTAGYEWASYKWCSGSYKTLSRYCTNSSFGTVDNKTEFRDYGYADDAARQTLGDSWRTPTDAEWSELMTECTWTEANLNGVYGYTVTGSNRNSIFLPYAGCRYNLYIDGVGSYGDYWSSTVSADSPNCVWIVSFGAGGVNLTYDSADRFYGQSIRPVTVKTSSQGR